MEEINIIMNSIIILFAIGSFYYCNKSTILYRKELNRLYVIIDSAENNGISALQEKIYQSRWSAYTQDILTNFFSQYKKYQLNIKNHINTENFIHSVKPYGSSAVPGILTAFGILGTFIGLIIGIGGMDTSSVETIMHGIDQLLGGLSTAFSTSIVGITCSILWNAFDKFCTGSTTKKINNLEKAFLKNFVVAEEESFEEYFKSNQEEQKELLEHLATDIATSIAGAFNESLSNHITPIFEDISGMVENMANTTTESYVEGIDSVAKQFIESMNSSLSGQFQNLSDTIEEICKWQRLIKEDMAELINEIQESVRDQKEINISTESVILKFSNMFDVLTGLINMITEDFTEIYDKSNQLNSMMSENLQSIETSWEEIFNQTKEQSEGMYSTQKELLLQLDKSITNNKDIQQNIVAISETVKNSIGIIEGLDKTLSHSTSEFKENMHSGIMKSFEAFDDNMGKITGYLNTNIESLTEALKTMEESIDEVKSSIITINDNFQKYVDHRYKSVEKNIENSIDNMLVKFNGLKLVRNEE